MNRHPPTAKEAPASRSASAPSPRHRQPKPSHARIQHRGSKPLPQALTAAKSLETENAVREDKIRRAKRLLQNAHYPSQEVIESVADLLARNLNRHRGISARSAG